LITYASYAMEKGPKEKKNSLKPHRQELPAILKRENSPNTMKNELFENLTMSSRELNIIENKDTEEKKDKLDEFDEKVLAQSVLTLCNLDTDQQLNELLIKRLSKMKESGSDEDKRTLDQVKNCIASKKNKKGIK